MTAARPLNGRRAGYLRRIAALEHSYHQAQFIGWPALAESFRRELAELRQQGDKKISP